MKEAKLIRYRDAHLKDYIWFWVVDNIRISPIYRTEEEALTWDKKPVDLS